MRTKQATLTAASVLVALSTAIRYLSALHQFHRGRNAYLAREAHYYDTVLTRHSILTAFLIALIGNALWLVIYEWVKGRLSSKPNEKVL